MLYVDLQGWLLCVVVLWQVQECALRVLELLAEHSLIIREAMVDKNYKQVLER